MNPNRKRSKSIMRWFRRNALLFILIAIIVVSMGVGAAGYALLTNTECAKDTLSTTIPPVIDETTYKPTKSTSVETESVKFYWDVPLSEGVQDYIRTLCEEFSIPEELILAMIEVESSFRPTVISTSEDYGYMQINKCNHERLTKELGVTDFLDPYQNILCGVYLISEHLEKTESDAAKALMRYNCGATGAWRLWQKGVYSTEYTRKVMSAYEIYKEKSRPDGATS